MGEKQKTKSEVLTDFLTFEAFVSFLEEICKIEVQPVSSPDPQGPSDPKVDKLEVDIEEKMVLPGHIDPEKQRFPYCIVWTPIPFLTWLFPFIGHMGIATSAGVIRDFAGPYYVGEGAMAFGKPTRYLQMDPSLAAGGAAGWDRGVAEASEIYRHRIHNLFCDNCHSHTATALDHMQYRNKNNWNMVKLASIMFFKGKYVGFKGFCITWIPSLILVTLIVILLSLSSTL